MIKFLEFIIEGFLATVVVLIPVAVVVAADMLVEERRKQKDREHPIYTRLKSFVYDQMQ